MLSVVVSEAQSFDTGTVFLESDLEKDISVLKESLFEADDEELAVLKVLLDHKANILGVR